MRDIIRRQEAKGFSKAEAMERIRRGEACFIAGTPVATAAGVRSIEEIVTGLEVTSRDMETGKVDTKPVVQVFRREVDAIVYIGVAGEPAPIGATTEHPFWTRRARDAIDSAADEEGWTAAGELRAGDLLLRSGGEWIAVTSVERRAGRQTVYNFEVAKNHTYFVGTAALLVHNACVKPGARNWREYEQRVAAEYGEVRSSRARTYLSSGGERGVADNIATIDGVETAIEAKFVKNWDKSIRNPDSPLAKGLLFKRGAEIASRERERMLAQAKKYSARFKQTIYHSNSREFNDYYSRLFQSHGINNVEFKLVH